MNLFIDFPTPSAPPLEEESTSRTSRRSQYSNFTEDESNVSRAETKTIFIRKIEVTINGTPVDQVEDKQNEEECMQAYWRMFAFNGQINSLFTNGIRKDLNMIK